MILDRRQLLVRTGLTLTAAALSRASDVMGRADVPALPALDTWEAVRNQFALAPDIVHMSGFFLASHPAPVRAAIDAHRRGLDADPIGYWFEHEESGEGDVLRAASEYLGVDPRDIALTDSTTMGLGLLYNGLVLRPGDEILTTVHDHYSTDMSLRLRSQRTGARVRQISLYQDLAGVTADEIVDRLIAAVTPATRIVAVTWVHSSTGLKLPIRRIADALAQQNSGRAEADRILLCVDGVHGLGVEDVRLPELGCDFFVAGTHKWLCGPRGTGFVWGRSAAWQRTVPTIPTFDMDAYRMWMKDIPEGPVPPGPWMTPGGFHSFEHRWALAAAFRFHETIGTARVAQRIYYLNRVLKEGLDRVPTVSVHTPRPVDLSAGITCFQIAGWRPQQVVEALRARRIAASVTPYATQYVRLAPSLVTSEHDVDRTLAEIRALAHR